MRKSAQRQAVTGRKTGLMMSAEPSLIDDCKYQDMKIGQSCRKRLSTRTKQMLETTYSLAERLPNAEVAVSIWQVQASPVMTSISDGRT